MKPLFNQLAALIITTRATITNEPPVPTQEQGSHQESVLDILANPDIVPKDFFTVQIQKRQLQYEQGRSSEHNIQKLFKKQRTWGQVFEMMLGAPADVRLEQLNYFNTEYVGKVYMGSQMEEVTVMFDTGSDWLVVKSYECGACEGDTYDHSNNEDFKIVPGTIGERNYGSTRTWGYEATDKVCLTQDTDTCIADFPWFVVTEAEGMETIEGLLGLSTGFNKQNGPLYMDYLKEAGLISKRVFAWYLTGTEGSSYLDIGTYKEEAMSNPADLTWISVERDNFWWAAEITAIKFGDEEYAINSGLAMTDTGTSCTYVPNEYYAIILEKIMLYALDTDQDRNGDYYIPCSYVKDLPTIGVLLGGYWLTILPEDYIVKIQGTCYICISNAGQDPMWTFGDSLLRGYYSVHDMDQKLMGFVPHSDSKKSPAVKGRLPNRQLHSKSRFNDAIKMGIWTFVIIACTIAVIAGLYFGGKYIYDNCYKTGEPNARRKIEKQLAQETVTLVIIPEQSS